jgi:hypothetical protein
MFLQDSLIIYERKPWGLPKPIEKPVHQITINHIGTVVLLELEHGAWIK